MSPAAITLSSPSPSLSSFTTANNPNSMTIQSPDFVNHELSATLDSTDAFEGPEKLLEIWFAPSENEINNRNRGGLRGIPLKEIENLLDLVNCKILSKISSSKMDSYLLSESSLFVFPHKLILKTCGTTTTLLCLEKLFQLALKYLGNSSVYRIFYSRRSFMFPERQVELHQSWDNELEYLNRYFDKRSSKAYVVGDLSNDHWYLYINGSNKAREDEALLQHNSNRNNNNDTFLSPPVSPPDTTTITTDTNPVDETFEMLMTDLSVHETPKFVSSNYDDLEQEFPEMDSFKDDYGHLLGLKTMAKTKLDQLFNVSSSSSSGGNTEAVFAKHDAFAFDPCGFSSNSIINDNYYYTLHVTPEEGWSYASFETNLPYYHHDDQDKQISKIDVMMKILNVFKPAKFCLVYMKEQDSESDFEFQKLLNCSVEGYTKIDKISYDLKFNYKCLYTSFEKIL